MGCAITKNIDKNNILEADGSVVKEIYNYKFKNWTHSEDITIFEPKSKLGICNIIKWANATNFRVRVLEHFNELLYTSINQCIFISMINSIDSQNISDLQEIKIVNISEDKTKAYIRIGSAITNEQLRKWSIDMLENNGNSWTMPLNSVVETTFGETNANICHGVGLKYKNLSNLVRCIEFVNVKGELQIIDNPLHLTAAAGCFGLLGIITELVLELDVMTYSKWKPEIMPMTLAIPPSENYIFAPNIKKYFDFDFDFDNEELIKEFDYKCKNTYSEWFWVPFSKNSWVNTLNSDGLIEDPNFTLDYPSLSEMFLQKELKYIYEEPNILASLSKVNQDTLEHFEAMHSLHVSEIVMPVSNLINFGHIQNIRVRNMEFSIPIPNLENGEADFNICREIWWGTISIIYKWRKYNKCPVKLSVEMRIIDKSDILLSTEYGNNFGTCCIEVVTTTNIDEYEWLIFRQDLVNLWALIALNYKKNNEPLAIIPHFTKDWQDLTIIYNNNTLQMIDYLKIIYKDNIIKFKFILNEISQDGGYTFSNLDKFSTLHLNKLICDK